MNINEEIEFQKRKIVISTGLALFAMFFGAGNIIFPLYLGAHAGKNIMLTVFGFLLAGIGVPFLGLLATSLYDGDFKAFFGRLGKIPAFLIITFLMVIIGPLVAIPRTETTTFNILLPYLPDFLNNNLYFSLIYCLIVFLLAYRDTKVISVLGYFLSPVKIVSFTILILLGFIFSKPPIESMLSSQEAFKKAISHGYNTMDMLAAFFYCSVAFKSINLAVKNNSNLGSPNVLTFKACIIGAITTGVIYVGFMLVAYVQASALQNLPEERMISAVSTAVLGKFGGFFVCFSVCFACVATALSLAEVSSEYLHVEFFRKSVSKIHCLILVMIITVLMSNLGFQGIMKFSMPLLNILYPALIVLCIMNILYKWKGVRFVKLPFIATVAFCVFSSIFS